MTTSKITQSSEATSMAFSSVNTSPDGIRGESTGYSCTNSAAKLATGGLNQGLRLEWWLIGFSPNHNQWVD